MRPIAIASVCVRAWNRRRAAQLARWLGPLAPTCMAGGLPGRAVEGVLEPLLSFFEEVHNNLAACEEYWAVSWGYSSAFDR
eukprot:9090491-Alexandrium_andersonii.AAC.1